MATEPILAEAVSRRTDWDAKYRTGPTPWDTRITPPEVCAFWNSQRGKSILNLPGTPKLVLDIGCGTGTNTAFLARQGLYAVGIELSSVALGVATLRHRAQQLRHELDFVQADVAALPLHSQRAHYILDIGCMHGLPPELRPAYAAGIIANLASDGYYQLYAFDREPDAEDVRGLTPNEAEALLTPDLTLVEAIAARPDRRPCHWYLFQRSAAPY